MYSDILNTRQDESTFSEVLEPIRNFVGDWDFVTVAIITIFDTDST